jgi:hypothetical protein
MRLFRHFVGNNEKAARGGSGDPQGPLDPIRIGAYFHSAEDLYRVEEVCGEHALVEDCRSGDLIDVPLSEFVTLEPVRVTRHRAPHPV